MSLDVNGERKQTGSTSTMIFSIPFLLAYITQFMVLEPGDVVTTGTPPGVGSAKKPPEYLKAGDELRSAGRRPRRAALEGRPVQALSTLRQVAPKPKHDGSVSALDAGGRATTNLHLSFRKSR